jgi:ABC-type polysaccharide/polyol phosphate transport system ATPase subunit
VAENAIDVVGVSKRFRFRAPWGRATVKDLLLGKPGAFKGQVLVNALDDVTFSVPRGCTLGVVGQNGSGKTTLLRVLAGIIRADNGEVRVRGHVAPMLALGTGFNADLTGRENAKIELLMLGLSRAEAERQIDGVIAFAELGQFIDAPMRTYSTGMAMRLAFAAAIQVDPEILLIDEVLSVGDERFAIKCAAWLDDFKKRGKTTVIVTHNSGLVASQCDLALWLNKGRVGAFGEPNVVVHDYLTAMREGRAANMDGTPIDYHVGMPGLLPLVRLPIVGDVRQKGDVRGAFDDLWTSGELEFGFEALRDVRGWTIRATIPSGMPETATLSAELDGVVLARVQAPPGVLTLHCDTHIPKGRGAKLRIKSSLTVNHRSMGISADVRDLGARIDEIVFDH